MENQNVTNTKNGKQPVVVIQKINHKILQGITYLSRESIWRFSGPPMFWWEPE